MTTYKSYAECKIANPDSEIVTTGKDWSYNGKLAGLFEALDTSNGGHKIHNTAWVICNPSDYCSTMKEFLEAGYKFEKGDKFIGINKKAAKVKFIDGTNTKDEDDELRYVLSAAALNGGCKIPDKSEPWTIYNNTLPLGELSDEKAAQLFNHKRNGGAIKAKSVNGWLDSSLWNNSWVYRAKPKSERELFIETSVQLMTSETERTMEQMFGAQFDSGARYTENTQHFGDSV